MKTKACCSPAKAETKETYPEEVAIKEASVEAVELSLENVKEIWPQVIEEASPPAVKISLKNGQLLAVDKKKLTVGFASSFHRDKVMHPEASRKIEEIVQRHLKRTLRLECIIGDEEQAETAPEPEVDLAEAAAEIF